MGQLSYPAGDGSGVTGITYEALMAPVTGSGMLGDPTQSSLVYADGTGRTVKVQPSRAAIVRAYHWATDTDGITYTLDANTSGQPRLDLCVLRLDRGSSFTVTFTVIAGTPAATPVAPAPTQQEGSTGLWDLPVAVVRVTSNATAGLPLIAASDVTPLEYYLAARRYAGKAAQMPAATPGALFRQVDTGKLMYSAATTWTVLGEAANTQPIAPNTSGWSSTGDVTRVNGLVYCRPHFNLVSGTAVAHAATKIGIIPAGFRPPHQVYMPGYAPTVNSATGNVQVLRGRADVDGSFYVDDYGENITPGQSLIFSPITYPATA